MSTKFYYLFLLCFLKLSVGSNLLASNKDSLDSPKFKAAISGNFGTNGPGLFLHYQINQRFGVKLGYFKGGLNANYFTNFDGNKIEVVGKFHFEMINLMLDFYPWKNKNLRVTTGIARNFNDYKVNLTPQSSQTFGYIVYTQDQIGEMSATVTGLKYAPYLGIGFDKTVPKHKIGIGLDIGTFYQGVPQFELFATGSFEPSATAENITVLEKAFNDWRFFPFINFQLKYRIYP